MRRRCVPIAGIAILLAVAGALTAGNNGLGPRPVRAASVALYNFSPIPIAAPGTLAQNTSKVITVTALDAQSMPVSGATTYLSFTQTAGGGSAVAVSSDCPNVALTTTFHPCTADSNGQVTVTYTTPSTLPATGNDLIEAQDLAGSPTTESDDGYSFGGVHSYLFSPTPVAPCGSLGGGASRDVELLALDAAGNAVVGAKVFLSFNGSGSMDVRSTALSSTPKAFFTDPTNGHIALTYTAPNVPPATGNDQVVAANASPNPTLTASELYEFKGCHGYWLVASDGGIFPFGGAGGFGSTGGIHLNQPIVGMAARPDSRGYWLVASDGGIFPFGAAGGFGSTGNIHLNQPIVGMAATPDGGGYWLVARDGGIFPFGDAGGFGSTGNIHLNQPIVGMAAAPDGRGYWLVAADGGIFPFGPSAGGFGSTGNIHLNQPVVGMAATKSGQGYWLVASDGGIFPFGDALNHSYGSTGGMHLNQPIVGMAATFDGNGYYLVASDGGLFPFGDGLSLSFGSTGGIHLNKPMVGMAATD